MKKINHYSLILILLFFIGLTSCKKNLEDKFNENQNQTVAKTTSEIKAATTFKWKTTGSITLVYKAKPNDIRVSVLKVISPDGHIIYQKLQKANQDLSINLEIPSHFEKVDVSFGSNKKSFDTKSGKIEMLLN
jgi:hypothetical protein